MTDPEQLDFGRLRAFTEHDKNLVLAWRNAPGNRFNMYTQHEIQESEHSDWWENRAQIPSRADFIYELDGQGQGVVAFTDIDIANRTAFWAFYAAPDAPKGVGWLMEYLALEHALVKIPLRKLSCEVLAYNSRVLDRHKTFGFKVEGVFREHKRIRGEYCDVYRFGMLAHEWMDRRLQMQETAKGAFQFVKAAKQ